MFGMLPLPVSIVLLWILGQATLSVAIHWWTKDRRLHWVIGGSFLLRLVAAIVLYSASRFHCPLFRSLQCGGGFWLFGLDSHVYHKFAAQIAEAWAKGVEIPVPDLGIEYFAVVATVYRLLGPHPFYAIWLNCWLSSSTGLLAYLI